MEGKAKIRRLIIFKSGLVGTPSTGREEATTELKADRRVLISAYLKSPASLLDGQQLLQTGSTRFQGLTDRLRCVYNVSE